MWEVTDWTLYNHCREAQCFDGALASSYNEKQQIDGLGLTFAFQKVYLFLIVVMAAKLYECTKSH